jgi:hypothetical protein
MNARRGGLARQRAARMAIVPVLAFVLVASAAWARPPSDQERASLATTVEGFAAATRAGDYARVAQIVPPKVVSAFARRAGVTPEEVIAVMTKAMEQMFQGGNIKIESFRMDLASADHKELADGAPYVLIPTHTSVALDGRRFQEQSHTLAILDGGRWYLLRINDAAQLQFLLEAHPEFTSVKFPSGSLEALNP